MKGTLIVGRLVQMSSGFRSASRPKLAVLMGSGEGRNGRPLILLTMKTNARATLTTTAMLALLTACEGEWGTGERPLRLPPSLAAPPLKDPAARPSCGEARS
jgi:hypothetical protein